MRKTASIFGVIALATSLSAFAADSSSDKSAKSSETSAPSIQQVVQNPSSYVGKTLTLSGKVDRVLPSGDFIMKAADSDQGILVFTVKGSQKSQASNQQAGTSGTQLKENQKVEVKGKVNQLVVTNEYDVVNLKKDREKMSMVQTSTPVLLARPADVKAQG